MFLLYSEQNFQNNSNYYILCHQLSFIHKRSSPFAPSFSTVNFWVRESGGKISLQMPAIIFKQFPEHSKAFIMNKSLMFFHTLMNIDLAWKNLIKNIVEKANVADSNSQEDLYSCSVNYLWSVEVPQINYSF